MREHEYETEIDTRLEGKLGFDRVRTFVADRCSTEYAVTRVTEERFSNDPKVIRERLALTDEMRLIVMFEENFFFADVIDVTKIKESKIKQLKLIHKLARS